MHHVEFTVTKEAGKMMDDADLELQQFNSIKFNNGIFTLSVQLQYPLERPRGLNVFLQRISLGDILQCRMQHLSISALFRRRTANMNAAATATLTD